MKQDKVIQNHGGSTPLTNTDRAPALAPSRGGAPKRNVVIADWPEEGHCEYFDSQPEAADYARGLISEAVKQAADNEGKMPNWLDTVQILRVDAVIGQTMDGHYVRWLA